MGRWGDRVREIAHAGAAGWLPAERRKWAKPTPIISVLPSAGTNQSADAEVRPSALLREEGSSLVELGVVACLLLTFIFGIMDFSRFMYAYHFVSEVAREGTRYAAVHGSTFGSACSSSLPYACYATSANVQTYVQGLAPSGITSTSVTATTTWPGKLSGASGSCTTTANSTTGLVNNPGCLVEVAVTYPFKFFFPFLPSSATTYTLSSTSEMVIQQ